MKRLLLLLPLLTGCVAYRTDRPSIVVYEGRFDFQKGERLQETIIEYRFAHLDSGHIRPVIGLSIVGNNGLQAYTPFVAGRYDLNMGAGWIVGPSFGLAYYSPHNDHFPDLGSTLQFRSAIDISRRVTDELSIGLGWVHLSNANILGDTNPGADSIVITIGWSF